MSEMIIQDYLLRKLKSKFEKREFAIPEIQRQFVWKKAQICNLMDSIFKNFPIGICLVWRSPYSQTINIRPNNKTILPPFNKRAKENDLIIDGQQRLSSIYGVLFGVEPRLEANSPINYNDLFFDCNKKAERRFVFSKRLTDDTPGHIRLTTLLNTKPSALNKRYRLRKWEAREALKCYKAFNSYKFYTLAFNRLGYDDVKQIFIRINSGGMKVSRADALFANASNVALREHMLDTKRGLKFGFDKIPIDALQNTLGLAYGAVRFGNVAFVSFLKKIEKNKKNDKEFEKTWKKLQYGYEEAADFLVNSLKVQTYDLLPSQNIYSILSYFFFLNQSRVTGAQFKEIKKWFWHTVCGDRYTGKAFNRNIPEDIKFFKRLSSGKNAKYPMDEKIYPIKYLESNYKNLSASATRAYFIILRNKKPKYLLNGQEMLLDKPSSISNRQDKHHIFPAAFLRRRKINSKWVNCIANICYLESDENQSINDRQPNVYLDEYRKKRHFGSVMKSHLIDATRRSPIWEKNLRKSFIGFINLRGRAIIGEIEKLAGAKIFYPFDSIKRV